MVSEYLLGFGWHDWGREVKWDIEVEYKEKQWKRGMGNVLRMLMSWHCVSVDFWDYNNENNKNKKEEEEEEIKKGEAGEFTEERRKKKSK